MQDIIFLFKERFSCCDVFNNLYLELKNNGFNCVKIIDEKINNVNEIINSLIGKKIVLITADHTKSKYNNNYSISEIVNILNPIKKYYGLHDLGIHSINEEIDGWHVLLPHNCWSELLHTYNVNYSVVGYYKFINNNFIKKFDKIFFPSSIYVYVERDPKDFLNYFKYIVDENIPIKFPDYSGSIKLIDKIKNAGTQLNIINTQENTFDLICASNTVITNANSSIAVEAAIAGCNSINIGVEYLPKNIFNNFNIKNISSSNDINNVIETCQNPMNEYIFNMQKCINIITNV